MKTWQFEPLDTSFFRGARSFQQNERGFLESQFPPTAQTLAGVIRAAIAESKGVDWQAYRQGNQPDIAKLIGASADDVGSLLFAGPYLTQNDQRLYPVPLHLLHSKDNGWGKLAPAEKSLVTDMGERQLPEVVKAVEGAKPLEDGWLDAVNFNRVLKGNLPTTYIPSSDLFRYESRTGIARDNPRRKTLDGALFFTRHIRLEDGVKLAMDVDGADGILPASMLRLGGEGRMAHVMVKGQEAAQLAVHQGESPQFMLILLTHGDFNGQAEPTLPEGYKIVSACVGKAVREGGWDYKLRQPKPLKSLVPAGSVYFVKGDASAMGSSIGERTAFGYGEIKIGKWENSQ